MISISHWGMFEPDKTVCFGAPPIAIIADIYRISKALEDNIASTKGSVITGTYLRMTA